MGFYLYFCLILAGNLTLFVVGIVDGLILLLQLQMVLGSVMRRIVHRNIKARSLYLGCRGKSINSIYSEYVKKVNHSRYRPGQVQRVPGS